MKNTLVEYEQLASRDCKFCESRKGMKGTLGGIEHYDHSGGYNVRGFISKQWLYRTCSKCGHQWSLVHLKVPK